MKHLIICLLFCSFPTLAWGWAPPPPDQDLVLSPPSGHVQQPTRRRRQKAGPPLNADVTLGHSVFWYAAASDHLSMDLEALSGALELQLREANGLSLGYSFKILKWRMDRWFQRASENDTTLSDWEFGQLLMRVGGKHVWLDAGFLGGRMFQVSLPLGGMSRRQEGPIRNRTFESPGGMFLLPRARLGLRFGRFYAHADATMLHWDFANFRIGGEVGVRVSAIRARAGVTWQRDNLWLQQHDDDTQPQRLWLRAQREFVDTYLEIEVNLGRLFSSLKALRYGPVVLHAGTRYRRYIDNRLLTERGATWFAPGVVSDWSFSLGLRVAWGIKAEK